MISRFAAIFEGLKILRPPRKGRSNLNTPTSVAGKRYPQTGMYSWNSQELLRPYLHFVGLSTGSTAMPQNM